MIKTKLLKNGLSFLFGVLVAVILFTQGHYFLESLSDESSIQRRRILNKNEIITKKQLSTSESPQQIELLNLSKPLKSLQKPETTSKVLQSNDTKSPKCHRILCWVMTSSHFLNNRTKFIKQTWGPRCDITLYFSDKTDNTFPTIGLYPDEEGRDWLSFKSAKAWTYVYTYYFDKADYFVKTDDDTYLIVENLRDFLKDKDPSKPEFFGRQFLLLGKGPLYMSGGASVVLSKESLRLLIKKAFVFHPQCISYGSGEDMKISRCLTQVGAVPVDSRDEQKKERFHPFLPEDHLSGNYMPWFIQYDVNKTPPGMNSTSEYPISFHYVRGYRLLAMDYLLYYAKVKHV